MANIVLFWSSIVCGSIHLVMVIFRRCFIMTLVFFAWSKVTENVYFHMVSHLMITWTHFLIFYCFAQLDVLDLDVVVCDEFNYLKKNFYILCS
jgi:hypothetical protein